MRTKSLSLGILTLFLLSFILPVEAQEELQKLDSQEAALKWLKLMDEGRYNDSWDVASLTFRLTIPKKHWVALMRQIRTPLGDIKQRAVVEQRPALNPKGLPEGKYMVIYFETSFSEKSKANELVTLVLESDGQWRILTYQVQ